MLLTPLAVAAWQRLTPPPSESEFDALGADVLKARNKYLDHLFTFLMFAGAVTPLPFIRNASSPAHAIAWLGLGLGLMVDLPVAVIAGITLRHGVKRFREFWRFYEIRWGIGMRGIVLVYTPIGLLGVASLVVLLLTP